MKILKRVLTKCKGCAIIISKKLHVSNLGNPMKITRATVAKKAGVSVSTVSYVLNASRYVSPKLTEKVMRAVDDLGYSPDMAARSMVTKRSRILTIIANDLTNSMYGEIVMAIEREAMKRGYFINICTGQLPLKEYCKTMIGRRIDGVYFASVPNKVDKADIQLLLDNDIAISCGNYLLPGEKRINRVDVDYRGGMKQAIAHLRGLGHRKIVYLDGFAKDFALDEKLSSFLSNMKEYGTEEPSVIYGYGAERMTEKEGRLLAQQLVRKFPDATGVIVYSDLMAYGVLQQLRAFGYRVPQDISVVGIENNISSNFTNPPLTSLSFDRNEFACLIVQSLLGQIEEGKLSDSLVKMQLCIRESTAKPKET